MIITLLKPEFFNAALTETHKLERLPHAVTSLPERVRRLRHVFL